ncbi:MAG: NAD(P)H-hydrate epimerase, partial [Planctomycetes bacterium]|nr:NAD(P)H-hydrate epimerase [Planctomycetota bacterium]
EEMRELDRRAIEDYGIPSIILMENAGRDVALEVLKMLKKPEEAKVAILCGKGNNGGDGFVVGRHLYNNGVTVDVYLTAKISTVLSDGDAETNLKILLNMGFNVKEICTADVGAIHELPLQIIPQLSKYSVIVDALFGTGLTGAVREPIKSLIEGVNTLNVPIVAVDIPSGLDCNTGEVLGAAIKATKTVTLCCPKVGFFHNAGPSCVGELVTVDIGIPRTLII